LRPFTIYRNGEVTSAIFLTLFFSAAFGFFETNSIREGLISELILFHHFSIWHVAMLVTILGIGTAAMSFSLVRRRYIRVIFVVIADALLFAATEDVFWFLWRGTWNPYGSWSYYPLGTGFFLFGAPIPWIYVILMGLSVVFYYLGFRIDF
jgi:hypothetical protein